ncbi:hypothetical protein [Acetobacter sp.]|uniref:hypothetical protein n=1 Tax=Acetobacter sp. TaxID=440 RepID=UPI0025C1CBD4|nr:hypothetical protein [Acetobacter sp.]MCH4090718.1 hypothetical protein [Acetobacter sp.]MCI1300161.1 hypothetical protein [Acetobacter sp.]MCI1316579.1 hypothetical protein [Acetobacter sp.]
MTQQFIRAFSLVVGDASGSGLDLATLRVTFNITHGTTETPRILSAATHVGGADRRCFYITRDCHAHAGSRRPSSPLVCDFHHPRIPRRLLGWRGLRGACFLLLSVDLLMPCFADPDSIYSVAIEKFQREIREDETEIGRLKRDRDWWREYASALQKRIREMQRNPPVFVVEDAR